MSEQILVSMSGRDQRGEFFTCGAVFTGSNPAICTRAAPKIESSFVGRNIDKCRAIAKSLGITWHEIPCDTAGDRTNAFTGEPITPASAA